MTNCPFYWRAALSHRLISLRYSGRSHMYKYYIFIEFGRVLGQIHLFGPKVLSLGISFFRYFTSVLRKSRKKVVLSGELQCHALLTRPATVGWYVCRVKDQNNGEDMYKLIPTKDPLQETT